MSNAKFIWNPKKLKTFTFVHGRVVTSDCKDQSILEKLFNDPRKDVVILNPNFKPLEDEVEKKVAVEIPKEETIVQDSEEKKKCKDLKDQGMTLSKISKETGIPFKKVKEYVNEE